VEVAPEESRPEETGVDRDKGSDHESGQRLRVTEGLLAVARLLAGSLEIPELQRRAARELTLLLGADTSIFFSVADESRLSAAVAGYHVPKALVDPTYEMSMDDLPGYIVEALATRRPVASSNVAADPRFDHPAIRTLKVEPKSIVYTPLFSRGTIRGAFLSYWWNEHHEFTGDEIRLAEGVADQLALALENAALFAESRRAERRASLLAQASGVLDGSLDEANVLQALVRMAVPELADWCAVDIVDTHKNLTRQAAAHRDPSKVDVIYELAHHYPVSLENRLLAQSRVLETEESEFASDVPPDGLASAVKKWPHLNLLHDLGFASYLCVPLRARARILGTMLLVFAESPRRYTSADLAFAEDLAQRVALALDNAALYRESEARRRSAEALATIGRMLSQTLEVNVLAERVVTSARELVGGTVATLHTLDPVSGDLTLLAFAGDIGPGFRLPYTVPRGIGAIGLAVRERRAVVTPDLMTDVSIVLTDDVRERMRQAPYRAVLVVPLLVDDHVFGVLLVGDAAGRLFKAGEIDLVRSFGDQAAVALKNARLHEEKLILAHEDGRRRLAYDLHDGIAQLIVGAKQHLDTCRDLWETDRGRAEQELTKGVDRLGRAIVETRAVLRALRPTPVEAIGLIGAIQQTVEEMERDVGWSVSFSESIGDARLPSPIETSVFRIVQEALTNAARHARASHVRVELSRDGTWLRLEVRDDGVGFDVHEVGSAERPQGLGLLSMRERAVLLGGSCAVESQAGGGTRILVRLPLTGRQAG
jgi:signal transduction histidine kinase